jgi:hypothetical protein
VSDAGHTEDERKGTRRLDLKSAAAALGVTSEAVRRRAKRGTLPSEKGDDGRLYVWVSTVSDDGPHGVSGDGSHAGDPPTNPPEALLDRFEDENDFLRREVERLHRELERKDAILMTLAQRVPELEPTREAPPELRESTMTASEDQANGPRPPEEEKHPSWWRKLLFG